MLFKNLSLKNYKVYHSVAKTLSFSQYGTWIYNLKAQVFSDQKQKTTFKKRSENRTRHGPHLHRLPKKHSDKFSSINELAYNWTPRIWWNTRLQGRCSSFVYRDQLRRLRQIIRAAIGTGFQFSYPFHTNRKTVGIPSETPYTRNPEILHTPHPVSNVRCIFCYLYSTAWCMKKWNL